MKNKLANMRCLDLYLSGLSVKEYNKIKSEIGIPDAKKMPLLSWDFYMPNYFQQLEAGLKQSDLKMVNFYKEKFSWKNNLKALLKNNQYEALVLTDQQQKILWVNDGFTAMTGYSRRQAVNKTPKFLQGIATTHESRERFRKKIQLDKPFTEIVVNYRKDKSLYNCEVQIIPLYNQRTTHFLALEKVAV